MKPFQTLLLFFLLVGLAHSATAQTPQTAPVKPVPAVAPSRTDMARTMIDLPELDWTDEAAKEASAATISALEGVIKAMAHGNSRGFIVLYHKEKTSYEQIAEALEAKGYLVEVLTPKREK